MKKGNEKRREVRHRCNVQVDVSVYAAKTMAGVSRLTDMSSGGLRLIMKKPIPLETVLAVKVSHKKLEQFVNPKTLLLDTEGNPIVRVVHVVPHKTSKMYCVGARFLERPNVLKDRAHEMGI